MNDIAYIALLCVYSVILIVITLKSPQYASKIKQYVKSRKKRKQQYIEDVVLNYLKQLKNEKIQDEQSGRTSNSQAKNKNKENFKRREGTIGAGH